MFIIEPLSLRFFKNLVNICEIRKIEKKLMSKTFKSSFLDILIKFFLNLIPALLTKQFIGFLNFKESKNILISNVTGKEIANSNELKNLLVQQIESRVRWRESVLLMINKGIKQFIEIGPGKVLSGLIKRIDRNVKVSAINTEEDIKLINIDE